MSGAPSVRSIRVVWVVAVVFTLLAAIESELFARPSLAAALALIALTVIKIVLVLGEYMEIRHAPMWLRVCALSWVAATAAILITATLYVA